MSKQIKDLYEFGEFRLVTGERLLLRDGKPVPLTPKAFETLLVLVRRSGHLVEKDELMKAVWADAFVEEANLARNIWTLRKALGDEGDEHHYIETVPKIGYRFVAQVRERSNEAVDVLFAQRIRAHVVTEELEETEDQSATDLRDERVVDVGAARPAERGSRFAVPTKAVVAESLRAWVGRKKKSLAIASLSLVAFAALLLVAAIAAFNSRQRVNPRRAVLFAPDSISMRRLPSSGNVKTAAISPDGQTVACAVIEEGGQSLWVQHADGQSAVRIVPPAAVDYWGISLTHDGDRVYYVATEGARGILYQVPLLGGAPRKLIEGIDAIVSFSPDDQRMAFTRYNDTGSTYIITANAADGSDERVIARGQSPAIYYGSQWSPDGNRILYFAREPQDGKFVYYLAEVPAVGGEARRIGAPRNQMIFGVTWLADGSGILMSAADPASNLPQLWNVSYPGGEARRITNDLDQYLGVSVSANGSSLVSVQTAGLSYIWILPDGDVSQARRIPNDVVPDKILSWTPDKRIVFDAIDNGKRHIWIMDADGIRKQQLSPERSQDYGPSVSPDGRYIVFLSNRSGQRQIWRMEIDGRNPQQLTNGNEDVDLPGFGPGGETIIFNLHNRLAQVSINGGPTKLLTNDKTEMWDVSPDGKTLASLAQDLEHDRWRIVVRSLEEDDDSSYFDFAPYKTLHWTPDGGGLAYAEAGGSHSTIMVQPLAGGAAKPLLNFTSGAISGFAWSRDGRLLALVSGTVTSHVVLINQRR